MKQFSYAMPSLILTTGLLFCGTVLGPTVFAQTPSAAPTTSDSVITKTIFLKYLVASQAVHLLKEPITSLEPQKTKSLLPAEIKEMTASDSNNSIQVIGAPVAVAEVESMIRLLDVKPRAVEIKIRLFEIRLGEDGTPTESLVQSPTLTTVNNTKAQIGVSSSDQTSTKISAFPHINGDNSISLGVSLAVQRAEGKSTIYSEINRFTRTKQGEWKVIQPLVSLSSDQKIQQSMLQSTAPPVPAAYPLYRLEVSTTEVAQP